MPGKRKAGDAVGVEHDNFTHKRLRLSGKASPNDGTTPSPGPDSISNEQQKKANKAAAQARLKEQKKKFEKLCKAIENPEAENEPEAIPAKQDTTEEQVEKGKRKRKPCRACSRLGHISTNKRLCPALNGEWPNGQRPQDEANKSQGTQGEDSGEDKEVSNGQKGETALSPTHEKNLDPQQDVSSTKEPAATEQPREPDGASSPSPDRSLGIPEDQESSKEDDIAVAKQAEGSEELDQGSPSSLQAMPPAQDAPKTIEEEEEWYEAMIYVNDVLVGTMDREAIRIMKPLPTVIGPLKAFRGWEQGPLRVKRISKGYVSIGGAVASETAIEKGISWEDRDCYTIRINRRKKCQEIRIVVKEGSCVMYRDGTEIFSEVMQAIKSYEKVDVVTDGSFDLSNVQAEHQTFEEWREASNKRLARMKFLRVFPAFPKNVGSVRSSCWHNTWQGVHCRYYKGLDGRGGHPQGVSIKACPHDLMDFIANSETAKTTDPREIINGELRRFRDADWNAVEDEKLRETLHKDWIAYRNSLSHAFHLLDAQAKGL